MKIKPSSKSIILFLIVFFLALISMKASALDQLTTVAYSAGDSTTVSWFPFTMPWDDASDGITNIGGLVLDAPAGKHGFLKVKDGHFHFEDGTRVRFWGVNLTAAANFPTQEESEKIAARFAKLGFNIVRLHHMDSNNEPRGIFEKAKDTSTLSEKQLERLDYLIYQLKQRGIYVDINLHVGRKFTEADGVADAKNLPRNSKQATMFNKKLIELQKDYAAKLLTHLNPYTGLRYTEDPCVALVETTNENTLFTPWTSGALFGKTDEALPEVYMKELDSLWNQWLTKKYISDEELAEAWNPGIKDKGVNLVKNPGFESDIKTGWVQEIHKGIQADFVADTSDFANGKSSLRADITGTGSGAYQLQFKQLGIKLEKDVNYTLRFLAKADRKRSINVSFGMEKSPWTNYGLSGEVQLSEGWEEYRLSFNSNAATDNNTRLSFILGKATGSVWLDKIELFETVPTGLAPEESLKSKNISRTKWNESFAFSEKRLADNTEFYYTLEKDYFKEMLEYIRGSLKIRVPVSTSNNYYGQPDLMAQNEGDYIDAHGYWDHPSFPDVRFDRNNFKQRNLSLIRSNTFIYNSSTAYNSSPVIRYTMSGVKDKPLVISEWNHVFPNDYEYEEAPILAAYGLLQDWDGFFVYTFSHGSEKWDLDYMANWFNIINSPVKLAQMPSAALAFIRGDFKSAERQIELNYSKDDVFKRYRYDGGKLDYNIEGSLPFSAAYTHSVRKSFNDGKTSNISSILTSDELKSFSHQKKTETDTGETQWNMTEKDKEYVTFNTPLFLGADGFISNMEIRTGALGLRLLTDCSASLSSIDGREIPSSGSMLLTLVARQQNTGQEKDSKNGLKTWGKAPVLLEPVMGTIELKLKGSINEIEIYALDSSGQRYDKIPFELDGNTIRFSVGSCNTPWYEIQRQ